MKVVKLLDVAKIKNNRVNNFQGFRKYIATGDVSGNRIISFTNVTYEDKPSRANIQVDIDKVIFARMKETNKVIRITKENQDYIYSTGFCVLEACEKLLPEYLELVLKSPYFRRQKDKLCTGATQKAINNKNIKKIKIPLPPLQTQKKIVEVLDKAQELIDLRKKQIELLDELIKSVFYDMFYEFEKWDTKIVEKLGNGEKYDLSSGPFGSNLTSKHFTKDGVIVLRGTNISDGKLDLTDVKYISEEKAIELKRSEIKPNDLVIIAVGSSGKALKIPDKLARAIISQNFNKVSPNLDIINPIYFEYAFNSFFVQNQIKKYITDTVRTFLSLTKVKKLEIPIPPLELQNEFTKKVQKIEEQKELMHKSLIEMENNYNSLMQRAFKGELFH